MSLYTQDWADLGEYAPRWTNLADLSVMKGQSMRQVVPESRKVQGGRPPLGRIPHFWTCLRSGRHDLEHVLIPNTTSHETQS